MTACEDIVISIYLTERKNFTIWKRVLTNQGTYYEQTCLLNLSDNGKDALNGENFDFSNFQLSTVAGDI